MMEQTGIEGKMKKIFNMKNLVLTIAFLLIFSFANAADYYVNYSVADQGALSGMSFKSVCTAIGSNNAKIIFKNNSGSSTSPYVFLTSFDSSSVCPNAQLEIQPGARLVPSSGITVTLPSPSNVIASNNQQVFAGDGTISFAVADGFVTPEMFGQNTTPLTTDMTAAWQAMVDSLPEGGAINAFGQYLISDDIYVHNKSISIFGLPGHPFSEAMVLGGSYIYQATNGKHGIYVLQDVAHAQGARRFVLKDFNIYGAGPNAGQTGHGLYIVNTVAGGTANIYVTLEHVGTKRVNEHGVFIVGCYGIKAVDIWGNYNGANAFRISRYTGTVEGTGTLVDTNSGENTLESINSHSCGQTGSTYDTKEGVYLNCSQAQTIINRISSSTNQGGGVILAQGSFSVDGVTLESNGQGDVSVSHFIVGDSSQSGYIVRNSIIRGYNQWFRGNSSNTGSGLKIDKAQNTQVIGTIFFDDTSDYDIEITANAEDTRILGHNRPSGTAASGKYSDAGVRTQLWLDAFYKIPPIVAGNDSSDVRLRLRRTETGSDIWGVHLDNGALVIREIGVDDRFIIKATTGNINIVNKLYSYANNAAAIAGGLVAGDLYRTGADPDVVCIVH